MRALVWTALLCLGATYAWARQLTPVWVAVGEGEAVVARVVVSAQSDCPSITIDGAARPMSARLPVPAGLMPTCELTIPAGAKLAQVNGHALALPKPDPSRVIVFGDTGCRIKGEEIQNCNDPNEWPFRQVAEHAARAETGPGDPRQETTCIAREPALPINGLLRRHADRR